MTEEQFEAFLHAQEIWFSKDSYGQWSPEVSDTVFWLKDNDLDKYRVYIYI